MAKIKISPWQVVGLFGAVAWLGLFLLEPSFPTLDRLIFLLVFVFMVFKQGLEALRRFLPFVVLILVYESFRSVADKLNSHVNYTLAPYIDRHIFGNLPTKYLQNWLWHGHVRWYDFLFYFAYMCHFIVPLVLGIIVWKTREKQYWRVIWTYIVVSFAGFITFWLFPAAPPWMASQNHYIQPVVRISSEVWASLGIEDFPSFYQHVSPNSVAAVPSLHAAWATLFLIFVWRLYGRRWAALASIYPLLIYIGTVYEGDHYAFDVIAGAAYAVGAYLVTPHLIRLVKNLGASRFLKQNYRGQTARS